ncbi:hypothetical protein F5Y17DRAFT_192242 [Xylariaceae sp. FL0594]|nr:hypothetical protein F5Y17DRAFT_192242 [Xylariaceae sp. FL0594]
MEPSTRQQTSSPPPLARWGHVTSSEGASEGGRGRLVSERAVTTIDTIDAQPAAKRVVHAQDGLRLGKPAAATHATHATSPNPVSVIGDEAALAEPPTADDLGHAQTWGTSRADQKNDSDNIGSKAQSGGGEGVIQAVWVDTPSSTSSLKCYWGWDVPSLDRFPNEVLLQILGFLDVNDLLVTSRINRHFRDLSLAPILHTYRLQRVRELLPPLLTSPSRPTVAELIARHIFLTWRSQVCRQLARNLAAIRLSRRLPQRPSAETLVQRGVLPPECVSGHGCAPVAPALVAKRRAVEKAKLKDSLRRWVGSVWRGEVQERSEGVKVWEEREGVGRVWRLRRFWERVARGDVEIGR